jgi:hypothetical protein
VINKAKTERGGSAGRVVDRLELQAPPSLGPVLADVLASARVRDHRVVDGDLTITTLDLAPKAEATGARPNEENEPTT